MKQFEITSICNALVDLIVPVSEKELSQIGIEKGMMHLTSTKKQSEILETFSNHETTLELGGSALNAIRTLRSLGVSTSFFGAIGQDEFGSKIKERMLELGIFHVLKELSDPTGTSVILTTPDGERTMNTHLGASRLFDETFVSEEHIAQSDAFHFCGYQWDTPGQIRAIQKAMEIAKSHSTAISFDVADPFVVERNREAFLQVIRSGVDIVFANKEEAQLLFQKSSPNQCAQEAANLGAIAVIKLGAKGALIRQDNQEILVQPVPTQVIDTTAAGDMFAAGFLYGWLSKKDLNESGQIAAILAADVISRMGAKVSDNAIEKVLRDFPR